MGSHGYGKSSQHVMMTRSVTSSNMIYCHLNVFFGEVVVDEDCDGDDDDRVVLVAVLVIMIPVVSKWH